MTNETIAEAAMGQHVIEYGITDAALAELKERYKDVDASKDYDGAKAALKECTSLRTALENKRKGLKRDALEYGRKVDSEAKRILGKILEVETPIKDAKQAIDYEAARVEAERVAKIEAKLRQLAVAPPFGAKSGDLQDLIDKVDAIEIDESFGEEIHRAKGMKADTLALLRGAFAQAVQTEEQARKLKELEDKQKEEDARIAAERAEIDKREREQREEQERIDAEKAQLEADKEAEKYRKQREADAAAAEELRKKREEEDRAAHAARVEALRPDKEKLLEFSRQIATMKPPKIKSPEAHDVVKAAQDRLTDVAAGIKTAVGFMQ